MNVALPVTHVTIDGVKKRVLIYPECLMSIVHVSSCSRWSEKKVDSLKINGERHQSVGVGDVNLLTRDGVSVDIGALVVKFRLQNLDVILGMNGIAAVVDVTVKSSCNPKLDPEDMCGALIVANRCYLKY